MLNIRTLLSLLAMGSVMVDNPFPTKDLVRRAVQVIVGVTLGAVMVGALLLALVLFSYQTMTITYGIAPLEAALYIVLGIAALTLIAILYAVMSIKKLGENLPKSLKKNIPFTSHLGNEAGLVVQSFLRGLMGDGNDKHPPR